MWGSGWSGSKKGGLGMHLPRSWGQARVLPNFSRTRAQWDFSGQALCWFCPIAEQRPVGGTVGTPGRSSM